jgi:1-aminocyclopropane-1-carboxylate deaminase/D-cysteine desulfhydrase-like pyridoxal-dependent ACC family enzyme
VWHRCAISPSRHEKKLLFEVGLTIKTWAGATMAGLAASVTSILPEGSRRPIVLGFPALKGGEFLADDATRLLRKCADPGSVIAAQAIFSLETAFHLGGYGKTPPELLAFMQTFPPPVPHQEAPLLRTFRLCHITHAVPHLGVPCRFYERTHVKLDPVYTSKMIFGQHTFHSRGLGGRL